MKLSNLIKKNLNSINYTFKQASQCDKWLLPLMILNMVIDSAIPFISVIFPKYIIDELTIGKSFYKSIILASLFFISNLLISSINTSIDGVISCKKEKLVQQHYKVFSNKTMSMDLEDIENPDLSDKKMRAQQSITWNSRNIDGIKNAIGGIISYSIQIIGFSYILSKLNIYVIFILLGIIILTAFLNNHNQKFNREIEIELTPINRRWNYLTNVSDDYAYGKLIRIYNLIPMILRKCIENRELFIQKQKKVLKNNFTGSILLSILSIIQEGVVYLFLVLSVVNGSITLGDFTMYLAATMSLTGAINNLIGFTIGLNITSEYINEYIDFISSPDSMTKKGTDHINNSKLDFEFKNVSYKYPFTDKNVLNNISIAFSLNDRITLVGDNGAGKTTFVKLLMRFYDPTSGTIMLNGKDIKEYDYEEYFRLFSPVFQDYNYFAFTIAENIAFEDAFCIEKRQKILDALNKSGILDKINSLPHNINSYIGTRFEEEGIDFSGGETQKIAIARSIYKNSQISVMDEPTANLSPISEYNIFKNFNDSTLDKTVLYISHRLTSTIFSKRILVFKEGQIIEDGTHRELLTHNGLYRKMFNMQSAYYTEGDTVQ